MVTSEYDFDNVLGKKSKKKPRSSKEKNTSNSQTASPFTVRLDEETKQIIRAICKYEGLTHQQFITYLIQKFYENKKTKVDTLLKRYKKSDETIENGIFD